MKSVIIVTALLCVSFTSKSQTKNDTMFWATAKPDTILLPEGVTSTYDSWLPTISIDPSFMADFAEWVPRNFSPRKDLKGRYWHMRHDGTNSRFTDKDVFDLFNSIRKKRKS